MADQIVPMKVRKSTQKALASMKVHPRETFDEVIARLIKLSICLCTCKPVASDETDPRLHEADCPYRLKVRGNPA